MELLWPAMLLFNTSLWAFSSVILWAFRRRLQQQVSNDLAQLVVEEIRKQDDRIQRRVDRASQRPPNRVLTEEEQEADVVEVPPEAPPASLPRRLPSGSSQANGPYPAGVSLRALGLAPLEPGPAQGRRNQR